MNTTATPNKSTALALDQKTNQGVDKYFGSITSLLVAGVNITPEVLKAIFQDDIDQTNALDTLEAQVKQQRSKQKAARKKATGMRQDLRTYILGSYGTSALQMLQDFGFTPPKARGGRKTASSKAQAVVQAKATRVARHTMGKRQKSKIKGSVPAQPSTTPEVTAAPPPRGS